MPASNTETAFRVYVKNHTKPASAETSPFGLASSMFVQDYRKGALAVANSAVVLPPGATHVEMEMYDRIDDESAPTDAVRGQVHTLKFLHVSEGRAGLLYGFSLNEEAFGDSGFHIFNDGMNWPLGDASVAGRTVNNLRNAELDGGLQVVTAADMLAAR